MQCPVSTNISPWSSSGKWVKASEKAEYQLQRIRILAILYPATVVTTHGSSSMTAGMGMGTKFSRTVELRYVPLSP